MFTSTKRSRPVSSRKPRPPQPPRRSWGRVVAWVFLFLFLFSLGAAGGAAYYVYQHYSRDLPDYTLVKDYRPNLITRVYARDGQLIGEFFTERRIIVPYSRLPRHLILAFLAAEDARFFEHPGIDLMGIVRAFLENVKAGEIVQGGSTITQQVVKSILLTSEKSYDRKLREAILAYRLENYMSKEELLLLYLNHIYLGNGAYGVEAAALEYFGKNVEDLDLAEAAMLAGLPKAPSRYAPTNNPLRAKERQYYVLNRMVEAGFIGSEEAQRALNQPLSFKSSRPQRYDDVGYYTDYVRQLLEERYGRDPLYTAGFRVYTSADVELHKVARQAIESGLQDLYRRHGFRGVLRNLTAKEIEPFCQQQLGSMEKYPPLKGRLQTAVVVQPERGGTGPVVRFGNDYGMLTRDSAPGDDRATARSRQILSRLRLGDVVQVRLMERTSGRYQWQVSLNPDPMAQAALVYLENYTGKVRVIMGGKDYRDSVFNRAVQAKRQPGSAFKAIIYAAAVEKGYGPQTTLLDEPISLPGGRRGEYWTPKNYDSRFYGPMSLASALAQSRNLPTVRLLVSIGLPPVIDLAKAVGLSTEIYPNYSSALGSSEVTLLDLTRAYSSFPTEGKLAAPIVIERLENREGRILEEAQPQLRQVMSPRTGKIMTELLAGVVRRGTGQKVLALKRPMGGKTGTTNNTRDAWFIGFTPSVTAGVWVGMDDERSLGARETGSQAAAPIFIRFMQEALANQPVEAFPELPATLFAGTRQAPVDYEASDGDDDYYEEEEVEIPVRLVPTARGNFFQRDLGE
ncbi:MAG: PBP1A family penicillin-binding protein [Deltaproteobacteria bacterium]|nr:PBP1A family penicillin-binding protein [Deltaproteobacteria bacterium]MBM4289171.1 PBP1A family penicillin-binding protein [Deltaproteobacteria bacterium]